MTNEQDGLQLHDLKHAWTELDRRLDERLGRIEMVAESLTADRTRTLVRRAMVLPVIELATTIAFAVLVAAGLIQASGGVNVACSIAVLAFFAALIASAIWQIRVLGEVDAAAPVLTTQRALGRVAALRVFVTKWTLLLSPALWAPFLVVTVELTARSAFGHGDAIFAGSFVLVNLLVGLVLTALLSKVARALAARLEGTSFMRGLLDDFAGRRLVAARDFLARLDGFEQD